MRALNAAGKDVEGGMKGLAAGAGTAGAALSAMGPAGMAAAAGIAAVVAGGLKLIEATKSAMLFGEALLATSRAAGMTTTTIQQYRYALGQAGGEEMAADQALKSFAERFGAAGEGVKRYLPFLEKLGFTPEQMRSWTSADEAVDQIAGKIASLANSSDRAFFAQKLGLEALLPLLAQGRGRFEELKNEALSVGVVMDEYLVRKLATAEEKFKSASDVIRTQFMSAIVDLAPVIVNIVQHIADLVRMLDEFLDRSRQLEDKSAGGIRTAIGAASVENMQLLAKHGPEFFKQDWKNLVENVRGGASDRADYKTYQANLDVINRGTDTLDSRAGAFRPPAQPPPIGGFTPAGHKGGTGPTADELAAQGARLVEQANSDLLREKKAELQGQLGLTADVLKREELQKQINAIDDQQALLAAARRGEEARLWLDKIEANKHSTEAEKKAAQAAVNEAGFAEIAAMQGAARTQHLRDEKQTRDTQLALAEQQVALDQASLQGRIEMDRALLAITHDMGERRRLALEIFDLELQGKEAQLKLTLAKQQAAGDAAGAAVTQKQLDALIAAAPAQRTQVSNANPANAWDAWVQKQKDDLPSLTQEWAKMKADGIDAFNQSLFDSQGRLQSFGSIVHSILTKMLVDLEQYLLKQAEVGLFGGGQGGGLGGGGGFGGWIMSLLGGGGGGAGGGAIDSLIQNAGTAGVTDLTGLFANGGRVGGRGAPGGPRLIVAHEGEWVMTRTASHLWAPLLDAMNTSHGAIPQFAAGGRVGGPDGGGWPSFGKVENHFHIDRSIYAPGADPATLRRIENRMDEFERTEPQRNVAMMRAAGAIPKHPRRPW
ncbi:MAG: hypothetical protein ACHP7N_00310 [Caulobacterales bacterium]